MDWETIEVTATQYPSGFWRRTELRYLAVGSVGVYRVTVLDIANTGESKREAWEFTTCADARKKYREER